MEVLAKPVMNRINSVEYHWGGWQSHGLIIAVSAEPIERPFLF